MKIFLAIAAIIRAYLFCELVQGQDRKAGKLRGWLQEIIYSNNYRVILEFHLEDIQSVITSLKYDMQDYCEAKYDYTITQELYLGDKTIAYYVGERAFLYKCMMNLDKERENEEFANLFLSYLIIKNKFMAELVQSNSRFGFANFAMYQERKGRYLCNT